MSRLHSFDALTDGFNQRQSSAFGDVYELLYERLHIYTAKLYKDTTTEPGDIIHDIFIKIWKSPKRDFGSMVEIKTYLFVSIKNSRNTLHSQMKYAEQYVKTARSESEQFRIDVIEAEVFSLFDHALRLLPKESAEILDLFFKGWKPEEIAKKLGKSPQSIYNRKSEALAILKKKIPKEHLIMFLAIMQ